MSTFKEWIVVLFFAAFWALGMPLWFYALSFLPGNRFKSIRKQSVLLRARPQAFLLWGLVGVDFGLYVLFGPRVMHGRLLVILAAVTAGAIATIFLSNRLSQPN